MFMSGHVDGASGGLKAERECVPAVTTHTSLLIAQNQGLVQDQDEFNELEEILEMVPRLSAPRITPWVMGRLLGLPEKAVLEILEGLWPTVRPLPGQPADGFYLLHDLADVIDALRFKRDGGKWQPLLPDKLRGTA